MALLACIIPFVDESSFLTIMDEMFVLNKVPPDQTPGRPQLLRLRSALRVLAQNTSFNEMVKLHHDLFHGIFQESRSDSSDGPVAGNTSIYQSIPSLKDIPRIIQFCHHLSSSEKACQLTYQGLEGAVWVASYAGQVLGISVCSRDDNGDQFELFANKQGGTSKVVIEPFWEETKCQIEVSGTLSDWLDIKCADKRSIQGWDVDCTKVDYFQSRTGKIYGLLDTFEMSELVGILTFEELNQIVKPQDYGIAFTHASYFSTIALKVQERALGILNTLGLDSRTPRAYKSISTYESESFPGVDFSPDSAAGTLDDWNACCRCILSDYFQKYISTNTAVRRGHAIPRVVDVLCEISLSMIRFTTRLAFTDWNASLRRLPAKSMDLLSLFSLNDLEEASILCTWRDQANSDWRMRSPAARNDSCLHGVLTRSWLAHDMDGLIVIRS